MKDELITFKTAKLAKEKGFDLPTQLYYRNSKYVRMSSLNRVTQEYHDHNNDLDEGYQSAPTQSLLQRWLREVHNIFIEIGYGFENNPVTFRIWITKFNQGYNAHTFFLYDESNAKTRRQFSSYEEALENALQRALELI